MNRLLAVIAVTFVLSGAAPASAQRQLPQWQPKVESHGYWQEFSFTDEAGYRHSAYCYYPSCKLEGESTQANVYELTLIDRKEIKNGSLHHYSSKLSPYILTRQAATGFWSKKYSQWKVTSASDAKFSTDMIWPGPSFVPPNFQYLVMAPTAILPTGTQMKAAKERLAKNAQAAKDKAEKERLAKEAQAAKDKAEQERLAKEAQAAKDKAEQERLAKEAAERERLARENAGKQPGKQPEPGKDQPAASNELTPFEIAVLKAGETDPEKAKIDLALKAKGTPEYERFVAAGKATVMRKAKAYVHPSWQPKNPNASKVWDRFDAMEQDYLKSWDPAVKALLDKGLAVVEKDPKLAAGFLTDIRSAVKTDFNTYLGGQASNLSAKEQLDRMSAILTKADGAKTIEEGKQALDETTSGRGSDKPLDKPGSKEQAANEQMPGKPNLANNPPKKTNPIPPSIGKDEGKEGAAAKFDTKMWVRRIGSTALAGVAFAIIGSIFGAPLLMGLLGIGLGILYNYAQDA